MQKSCFSCLRFRFVTVNWGSCGDGSSSGGGGDGGSDGWIYIHGTTTTNKRKINADINRGFGSGKMWVSMVCNKGDV